MTNQDPREGFGFGVPSGPDFSSQGGPQPEQPGGQMPAGTPAPYGAMPSPAGPYSASVPPSGQPGPVPPVGQPGAMPPAGPPSAGVPGPGQPQPAAPYGSYPAGGPAWSPNGAPQAGPPQGYGAAMPPSGPPQGYGGGMPPSGPPQRTRSTGLIVGVIIGVVVLALAVVGAIVFFVNRTSTPPVPSPPSSTTSTTRPTTPTATPTNTGTASGSGSFADLQLPAKIETFSAQRRYGSGRWIGAPTGSSSVGWRYAGTLRGENGGLIASLVQNSSISKLNTYSFTNTGSVGKATCGQWLSSYVACFVPVDTGFVGVQIDEDEFTTPATRDEVAALATSLATALS